MAHSGLSRRDILQHGAMLAGAGMLASCAAGTARRYHLTHGPEQAPIKGLGENAPVRVGCIGVGGRGTSLLHATLKVPNVKVAAICDLKEKNLNRAVGIVQKAQGHKADTYTDDKYAYRKLLARDDIDAVVLATPCYLHAPMYLDCLDAEKNFYGEKPMAITRKLADAVVAKAPKVGVVAQIGFQRRCSQRYHKGIRMVHAGDIGELIDGRGAWDNASGPLRGWFGHVKFSGDWMLEQACHTWDVFNWVAGALPTRAFGLGRQDIYVDPKEEPDRDVTDFYVATIEWGIPGCKPLQVRYSHSWGAPPHDRGMFTGVYERFLGTKGGVDLPTGHFYYRAQGKKPEQVVPKEGNHTQLSINSFFECVRKGMAPNSGVKNGRDATLAGLLVRKAVREERLVTMEEILKGP